MPQKPQIFLLLTLTLLLSSIHSATADFETASSAYQSKDYPRAYQLFLDLAESGDARAQTVLALMHKYGESVPADPESAYNWYFKAAVQGYPPALYNVGVMLADGQGVAADTTEAQKWLQKAVDAGYERAADKLAAIRGVTTEPDPSELPVAWSKSWNLRLPNEIRFDASAEQQEIKVFRAQLGAMSNLDRAQALWRTLAENNQDLLSEHQPIFREVRSGDRSFYRVQIGPFEDIREAESLCKSLNARGNRCLAIITN